ncbi:hypothetical protein IW262DRAFT_1388741 [Armillaria fumosa]|nr:hypothetical protein IW262DRAFT_1388741 [Armillaria fumosa]
MMALGPCTHLTTLCIVVCFVVPSSSVSPALVTNADAMSSVSMISDIIVLRRYLPESSEMHLFSAAEDEVPLFHSRYRSLVSPQYTTYISSEPHKDVLIHESTQQ